MTITKYNLDKLIKVKCSDLTPSVWYEYRPERKFLGIVLRRAGVYDLFGRGKDISEYHILKDGVVYELPSVRLYYEDGHAKDYVFDTFEQARAFADKYTFGLRWIR